MSRVKICNSIVTYWEIFSHCVTDCFILSLGICLGLQIAVIEFARDVLGWEGNFHF